jgi:hypothetical protein
MSGLSCPPRGANIPRAGQSIVRAIPAGPCYIGVDHQGQHQHQEAAKKLWEVFMGITI